jgi:hypothetical protein
LWKKISFKIWRILYHFSHEKTFVLVEIIFFKCCVFKWLIFFLIFKFDQFLNFEQFFLLWWQMFLKWEVFVAIWMWKIVYLCLFCLITICTTKGTSSYYIKVYILDFYFLFFCLKTCLCNWASSNQISACERLEED